MPRTGKGSPHPTLPFVNLPSNCPLKLIAHTYCFIACTSLSSCTIITKSKIQRGMCRVETMIRVSVAQGAWTGAWKSFGASGCWARDWMLTLHLSFHEVQSRVLSYNHHSLSSTTSMRYSRLKEIVYTPVEFIHTLINFTLSPAVSVRRCSMAQRIQALLYPHCQAVVYRVLLVDPGVLLH